MAMPKASKSLASPRIAPEGILALFARDVGALAERLSAIVKQEVPGVVEKAHVGWKGIGYRHPEKGYFCGIFP